MLFLAKFMFANKKTKEKETQYSRLLKKERKDIRIYIHKTFFVLESLLSLKCFIVQGSDLKINRMIDRKWWEVMPSFTVIVTVMCKNERKTCI